MRRLQISSLPALCVLALACASPPESECRAQPGEGSIDIDCTQPKDGKWSERAAEEAEEGFEERSPGGRP
jgi:hypothetical protein